MSGATHIVGGLMFAGTLCSFTDVNVFANPYYIGACIFFSILPDIDTTKSMIGFPLYPISWLIYQKFGHRTITHSVLFLIFVWSTLIVLSKLQIIPDENYTKIALFSTISHYVFDMITVSGIPFFYPFFKNRCVIPGNPAFRFKTSDLRAEALVFGICSILCFTMQPLFASGFWTSYNRQFGTIKHVDRENQNTEYYVVCEYSYIKNAELQEGEAIVIESKTNELTLFNRREVFTLNADDPQLKINHTRPRISTIEKRFEERQFFNVSIDSLHQMLNGKLATGLIQSNYNVRYIDNAITYYTNFINFKNRFDFHIYAGVDSSRTTITTNIARLEASISQTREKHSAELQKWQQHQQQIQNVEDSLTNRMLSNYHRNKLQQELISLRRRNYDKPVYQSPASQIAELEAQRKAISEKALLFSGHMTVYTFGFDNSGSEINFAAKPLYNSEKILANTQSYPLMENYAD